MPECSLPPNPDALSPTLTDICDARCRRLPLYVQPAFCLCTVGVLGPPNGQPSETGTTNGSGVLLFKDLVRADEKGRRDVETKRLRGLEIDGKQEFGGLLDRKVGRFSAFENSIDKMGAAPEQGEEVRAVRDQSTCLHNV